MELVEIRDLDGPNLFMLEPAIKIEFRVAPEDGAPDQLAASLQETTLRIHADAGLPAPTVIWQQLETPDHVALAFGWTQRRAAMKIARAISSVATGGGTLSVELAEEISRLVQLSEPDDRPLMVRDAERRVPIVGVTGTNGKTTTTRLIAHILSAAGHTVGWSSSSGVYIDGELVLEGDFTGPSGARRVLDDDRVDVAVLETARGGILLRGIAYESNDVSVFTNVSADHLDLQGVHTIEGLANVKATVVRVTRPTGYAVLNADDDLVRALAGGVQAHVFFISQDPRNAAVDAHVQAGGLALIARDQRVWLWRDGQASTLMEVGEIPITYNGRARHMVENALCAAAACIGLGRTVDEMRHGLATFKNDATHNIGRLNTFDIGGVRVIVDFAHNESGLRHLLALAADMKGEGGRIFSIIGTAGDRTDEALAAIGYLAGSASDRVFIKETKKYLRGRASNDELNERYVQGLTRATAPWTIEPDEMTALTAALAKATPADVVVVMCLEQIPEILQLLGERGRPI